MSNGIGPCALPVGWEATGLRILVRAVTCSAAVLLSLAMLAVNLAFELAGSVPDIEGCGFVAGSLLVLLLLYPALSAALSSHAVRFLIVRARFSEEALLRAGGRIGAWGALLYFALGFAEVLWAPHSRGVSSGGWAAAAIFTVASFLGGRLGALIAILRVARISSETARETGS
jgi:hypothetical protein